MKWGTSTNEEQQRNEEQHHKNLAGGSPKQSNIVGSFWLLKKIITELLLVLPLYLMLFFIWYRFRHLIKIMADAEDILNDEFFGDVVDTPKEGIEQHKKWEELKGIIDKGKLGHKWTQGKGNNFKQWNY